MIGVILAAGRGTRMRGLTRKRPKAMLPVVGQPIIARVIAQLGMAGIKELIIVVAADDRHIQPYFAARPPDGVQLRFVRQSAPRGMAHALLETAPYIQSAFVLAACDSLYPDEHYQQLVQTHQRGRAPATLTLMEVPPEEIARASSVEIVNGRVVRVVEKPSPADAPSNIASLALYAFDRLILDYLKQVQPSSRGELELQEAIQMMIANTGGLAGLTTAWRWELTTPDDLLMMNLNVLAMTPGLHVAPPDLTVRSPVFVERGVSLPPNVRLGPNVYLEAGAWIGPGAHLRNCVVLRDGLVPPKLAVEGVLISSE